jgi:hypothetical protein
VPGASLNQELAEAAADQELTEAGAAPDQELAEAAVDLELAEVVAPDQELVEPVVQQLGCRRFPSSGAPKPVPATNSLARPLATKL